MAEIQLHCEAQPIEAALKQLSTLAEAFPDAVQCFLDGLLDLSELVSIDSVDGPAEAAGDFRILFEPSDRLREFLAAARAGNVD
jgi:hypothetical protein